MNEIVTKLLKTTTDPNKYEITLTITGIGGFGKTTIVTSLCYHPLVKKHFTDGFVFIKLGPQATDPSIKLRDIHNLLTGEQCGINVVEQKINQLTSNYYHNLLVIIDDVWHVEDAEPLVKAFSNCKIILTTRMNNIEQYIPSKQSVIIGPMTQHEAVILLTSGVIDSSQLSQEDVSLLDELAQDVHLWPLLLSLIRGQLFCSLKQHLSYSNAIQNVQAKLHRKGLTAFDKNNIEAINKSRELAVKACIEITLELLTESSKNKVKTLILWTGIGTSLQTAVLHKLWNISKPETEDTVNVLWAYGLVQFTDITMCPNNITQHCVGVHAVISQYIIECMDSAEVYSLSPSGRKLHTSISVRDESILIFQQLCGIHDPLLLEPVDYVKHKQSEIENVLFPFFLKIIHSLTTSEPHRLIVMLQEINDVLMDSPYTIHLLSSLGEEIWMLICECKQLLKTTHKLCWKLSQIIQRNLYEKKYDKLIEAIGEFAKNYPLCSVAQKAVDMVKKKILPYCDNDGSLLNYMTISCEFLHVKTSDYHNITTLILPYFKLITKVHNQITSSIMTGSPKIEHVYQYFISGKFDEDKDLVNTNWLIITQEVAPNAVLNEDKKEYYLH